MSQVYVDHFFGQDWAHYASQASKFAAIASTVVGFIAIFMNFELLAGLIALISGSFLAFWEYPFAFTWLRNYEQIKLLLEESFRLKYEEAKGVACIIFGLLSFHFKGWLIISGILLLLTGVLFVFAAINRRSDEHLRVEAHNAGGSSSFPNVLPIYQPIPSETTSLPKATPTNPTNPTSASFGTFQA